jgi:hypothetical protein
MIRGYQVFELGLLLKFNIPFAVTSEIGEVYAERRGF